MVKTKYDWENYGKTPLKEIETNKTKLNKDYLERKKNPRNNYKKISKKQYLNYLILILLESGCYF